MLSVMNFPRHHPFISAVLSGLFVLIACAGLGLAAATYLSWSIPEGYIPFMVLLGGVASGFVGSFVVGFAVYIYYDRRA